MNKVNTSYGSIFCTFEAQKWNFQEYTFGSVTRNFNMASLLGCKRFKRGTFQH